MKITGFVLIILDVPEVSQDNLIGAGQVAESSRREGGHLVLGGWAIGEVEAGAGVGRDRSRALLRSHGTVGHHRCVRQGRGEGGWRSRLDSLGVPTVVAVVVDGARPREATHAEERGHIMRKEKANSTESGRRKLRNFDFERRLIASARIPCSGQL